MDTRRWSPTPGRTLVQKFLADGPVKYRARAKGVNPRTGEPQFTDFTLQGVIESMSNDLFTTVQTQAFGQPVITVRIFHSTRYLTEA